MLNPLMSEDRFACALGALMFAGLSLATALVPAL